MCDEAEVILLRDFHQAWKDFHAIPRAKENNAKMREASQKMVDAHHAYERYVDPVDQQLKRIMTLNG